MLRFMPRPGAAAGLILVGWTILALLIAAPALCAGPSSLAREAAPRPRHAAADFGADPTGAADSAAALQHCLDAVGQGGTCFVDNGARLKLLRTVTIPANTTLDCGFAFPDDSDGNSGSWGRLPALMLGSRHTIAAGGAGVAIRHCLIIRNGMTFPARNPSAYAGTAISGAGFAGLTLEDDIIIGFATAVDADHVNRVFLRRIYADGAGSPKPVIIVGHNGDSGFLEDIKLQPLAAATPYTCKSRIRPGIGLEFDHDTGEFVDNVVSQDFQVADYRWINANSTMAGRIWSDFYAGCPKGRSVGFDLEDTTQMHFSHAAAYGTQTGVLIARNGPFQTVFFDELLAADIGRDCLQLGERGGGGAGAVMIGKLDFSNSALSCARYAILYDDEKASSTISIHDGSMANVHGRAAPYIYLNAGISPGAQLRIDKLNTDLGPGADVYGGIAAVPVSLASAGVLDLDPKVDIFRITGDTDIRALHGVWSGREITLIFSRRLTVHNGGDLALAGGADFTTRAGSMLRLFCYGTGGAPPVQCKEEWRSR